MPKKMFGPFSQVLPMTGMRLKGRLTDDEMPILKHASVVVDHGKIVDIGLWDELRTRHKEIIIEEITRPAVLMPGFVDCHTHICFGGNRSADYALRVSGVSYLEIARAGGGIKSSVEKTRQAGEAELTQGLLNRIHRHIEDGVTTIEVKSGYGLNVESELKMLRAIRNAAGKTTAKLVSTCLAAHTMPADFNGTPREYLQHILSELLPVVKAEGLASRVDIFTEETAFSVDDSIWYLNACRQMCFDITVHADQFTIGGSKAALACLAVSADHLEASDDSVCRQIAASDTVAVVLPGASMGLGMPYAPARKLLDAGACLAISTDWNPGSAPMGNLLLQASVMGAAEKLSIAETLAGITYRAGHALRLPGAGKLEPGTIAQMQAYATGDYRDIVYHQGGLKPYRVWI